MPRIVDLTCPLETTYRTRQYPTISYKTYISPLFTVLRDGRDVTEFRLTTHSNTHVDAPRHIFDGGKPLDALPLESFYGDAVVLDIPKGELGEISAADLEREAPDLPEGMIVLLHTGWGKYFWSEPKHAEYLAAHHPGLIEDAGDWLADHKVKAVGIDCFAIRHPSLSPSLSYEQKKAGAPRPVEPVHHRLLSQDIVILEQLMNLEEVKSRNCIASFFPLPFLGVDGSPVRAVAIV